MIKGFRFLIIGTLILSGCSQLPKESNASILPNHPIIIQYDQASNTYSADIQVLIYNIAGLPWPMKKNRKESLRNIGIYLSELRTEGKAPHVVMLQEAFTKKSSVVFELSGYGHMLAGAMRDDPSEKLTKNEAPELIRGRKFFKGEKIGKLLNSGLAIMTDYPITENYSRPFKRRECAGYDCPANKGVLLTTIQFPGIPEPIEFLTTHMNSKRASGVSRDRYSLAHKLQAKEVQQYLFREVEKHQYALVAGGDFNTKGDRELLENLFLNQYSPIVRYYCLRINTDCKIAESFDGDDPWLDTQDLQLFFSGSKIKIKPIRVDAIFDEVINGKKLSDHDGYLVTYRVTWLGAS